MDEQTNNSRNALLGKKLWNENEKRKIIVKAVFVSRSEEQKKHYKNIEGHKKLE